MAMPWIFAGLPNIANGRRFAAADGH